jgi:hypothetical protein
MRTPTTQAQADYQRLPNPFRPNHWIITKDLFAQEEGKPIGGGDNSVGVRSPHCPIEPDVSGLDIEQAADAIREAAKAAGMTQRFRLLVDQDEEDEESPVMAEGYMMPLEGDKHDGDGFEPLDDYGEPNWGCITLEYYQNGEGGGWKTL